MAKSTKALFLCFQCVSFLSPQLAKTALSSARTGRSWELPAAEPAGSWVAAADGSTPPAQITTSTAAAAAIPPAAPAAVTPARRRGETLSEPLPRRRRHCRSLYSSSQANGHAYSSHNVFFVLLKPFRWGSIVAELWGVEEGREDSGPEVDVVVEAILDE